MSSRSFQIGFQIVEHSVKGFGERKEVGLGVVWCMQSLDKFDGGNMIVLRITIGLVWEMFGIMSKFRQHCGH